MLNIRKKEPKQTTGRNRWLPALFIGLLLCLAANILLKFGASTPETPKTPAEVFTRYLEKTVAERPVETGTVGAEAEAAIMDRVAYTVAEQSDTQVTLEITAPDMATILDKAEQTDMTPQDILDMLNGDAFPTRTTVLTVELDEDGNMIESLEFLDAMYGGLLTYLEQFVPETEGSG